MISNPDISLNAWIKTLPTSRITYPTSFVDRLKYHFWSLYTPYHSLLRDTLLKLRVIKHKGRHDFIVGRISPDISTRQFVSFLVEQGYGNHFISWKDDGELLSLRYVEDFTRQYHIRVFEDGEVRGHYEYTPESHPFWHLKEVGFEDRQNIFLNLLGNMVVRNT